MFLIHPAQVSAVDITVIFVSDLSVSNSAVPITGASCVCVYVCIIYPSPAHSSSAAEVTRAGFICVPTGSFLNLLGPVKGST